MGIARAVHAASALVCTGGDPPLPGVLDGLALPQLVIAADSGVEHALALGVHVDVVVGDLDSADAAALARAEADGAIIERHPVDKDATDLELALDAALARGSCEVVVIGGDGGRLDHLFANIAVLTSARFSPMQISMRLGPADVIIVRNEATITGTVGDVCTILPVGGSATTVRTTNLQFPLHDETLHAGTTRGVSNVLSAPRAHVSVDDGVLLVVLPNARKDTR